MNIRKKILALLIAFSGLVGGKLPVSAKPIVDFRFDLPARFQNCENVADQIYAILPQIETPARRVDYQFQDAVAWCVTDTWNQLGVIPVTAIAAEKASRPVSARMPQTDLAKLRYQQIKVMQIQQMDK